MLQEGDERTAEVRPIKVWVEFWFCFLFFKIGLANLS